MPFSKQLKSKYVINKHLNYDGTNIKKMTDFNYQNQIINRIEKTKLN